jgi:hypothetical protein
MGDSVFHMLVWLVSGAGLILGGLGSALGAMSWRRNRTLRRRIVELEDEAKAARQREAQRAKLRAFIAQELDIKSYLVIQNDGHGNAQNLTVSINGSSLDQCPMIALQKSDLAKMNGIKAQGGLRIPINSSNASDKLELDLTWSDASGELSFYKIELDR